MIKPEKTRKIPKIQNNPKNFPKKPLNFREKSPKNPKILPARFARRLGGSAGREAGGYYLKNFSYSQNTPPLGHVCPLPIVCHLKLTVCTSCKRVVNEA